MLYAFTFLNPEVLVLIIIIIIIIMQQKATYLNPPRPAGGCVFHPVSYCRIKTNAIYDLVFRTNFVRESGRTRKQSGVDCKL